MTSTRTGFETKVRFTVTFTAHNLACYVFACCGNVLSRIEKTSVGIFIFLQCWAAGGPPIWCFSVLQCSSVFTSLKIQEIWKWSLLISRWDAKWPTLAVRWWIMICLRIFYSVEKSELQRHCS
ncbi:hypothetical protein KC19_1G060600, partial [Ceratodon purpureus]